MLSRELRPIAGALSQVWAGGEGPTRGQIRGALMIAGADDPGGGNKQELVQSVIGASEDRPARAIIEELISLLRQNSYFDNSDEESIARLIQAVSDAGHLLTSSGYLEWGTDLEETGVSSSTAHSTYAAPASSVATVPTTAIETRPIEVTEPNLSLLISTLRRFGFGAANSVVDRRHPTGRPALNIDDEYDIQDIVEVLLRSMFNDVRNEEFTPSSAGSSSRMDMLIRERKIALELKATRENRSNRQLKTEILVDINDYKAHPAVKTLVVGVYDLVNSVVNPPGFEHDLSGTHGELDVHVLVIPWTGRRHPQP